MSSTPATGHRRPTGSIPVLMFSLLAAVFAFQLNASMLSPALATMERDLDATSAEIGLTQTAFFAAAALFSLFLPRWGDIVGRRKVMLGMLAVTALGCVISALAPNVTVLGIGRVVQGVAGPIVPMALIMLHVQVPDPKQYAKLMAVVTAVNGGIAGVDALLGGWLAGAFGFRSVFWVMAGVAVVAVLAIAAGTVESKNAEKVPMDWKGVVPLVIVLAALYFAFNEAGKLGDANWLVVAGLFVLGALAFVIFWRTEKRVEHPLVTTEYMKQRRTWALLLTTLLTMTGVFAAMNGLVPNLAQDPHIGPGISAETVSFWTLTPYAIAGLIMGPIAGQLASRWGFKRILQVGLVGTVLGLVLLAATAPNISPVTLLALSTFVGITYAGIVNIMLNGLGVVLSPPDNQGYLPGMNSGAFNLGAGLSFAILFAVNTAFSNGGDPAGGYRWGIVTGAVLVVLAFLVSQLIPHPSSLDDASAETAIADKQGENGVIA